jgi:hypothetical protein
MGKLNGKSVPLRLVLDFGYIEGTAEEVPTIAGRSRVRQEPQW